MGPGQMGPRTNGSQTNGSQGNWVPGQMGPKKMGPRTNGSRTNGSQDIIIIFIYLPSDVISQEKTATSSRSITKASKYAIPLKPTHKLAESKR